MTLELRTLMELGERKSVRSKSVKPEGKPRLETKISQSQIKIRYSDDENGKKGKPKGVKSIMYRWGTLDREPKNPEELKYAETRTSGYLTLDFNDYERGLPIYFTARWVNNTGEGGPWSPIKKLHIA